MVTYATVSSGIEGYNPPDYYRTLENHEDIGRFIRDVLDNSIIRNEECKNDVFNGMGKCTVNYTDKTQIYSESVILIRDSGYYIIGKIDSWEFVAEGIVEFKYTIDWYTSVILMCNWDVNAFPKGKTVLYRRLMEGEFTYSDENFTPLEIKLLKMTLKYKGGLLDETGDVFTTATHGTYPNIMSSHLYYLRYHDNSSNTDHRIFIRTATLLVDRYVNPQYIWNVWKDDVGLSGSTFNASSVLYWGECTVNENLISTVAGHSKILTLPPWQGATITCNMSLFSPDYYTVEGGSLVSLATRDLIISNVELWAEPLTGVTDSTICTDYNRIRILTPDGNCIYQVPNNLDIGKQTDASKKLMVSIYLAGTDNSPFWYVKINNTYWSKDNTKSFSIPFNTLTYFNDAYSNYLAEERVYNIEMRHLQSVNELVSGVIGGVNQGAMISAFSRTGARTGKQAIDKGFIGGGLAIAGSVANYAYQELYANKVATGIEDKYNRNKPDMLAMSNGFPIALNDDGGAYVYRYDDVTINNIKAYQSAFGYQTNKVDSNVELNHFTGYVQADVIFERRKWQAKNRDYFYGYVGLIEKYIKDMFNYGVYFTKVE